MSLVNQNYITPGVGETTLVVREVMAGTIENSPQYVRSWIRIHGGTTAPSGVVDTPANGTTANGSIALTGWAVDDIDITSVQVFRAEGAGEAFIGNAVRVDDARPDLVAAFPDTPFNYRAGWGYLLLTNFLPNGGDGTYTLRVYATDREGRRALLGERTIVGAELLVRASVRRHRHAGSGRDGFRLAQQLRLGAGAWAGTTRLRRSARARASSC